MELLARNGVVHASKLDIRLGRPLGVLTSFLSQLPDRITPITERIDQESVEMARLVANCTHRATMYQLLLGGLRRLAERAGVDVVWRRFASLTELNGLTEMVLGSDLSMAENASVKRIAERATDNLGEISLHLTDAKACVVNVQECIGDLRRTTRMSRYVYQCVRVEIAKAELQDDHFARFADRVEETVGKLEARLTELSRLSREGHALLSRLAYGVQSDEEYGFV